MGFASTAVTPRITGALPVRPPCVLLRARRESEVSFLNMTPCPTPHPLQIVLI
jgi:hypothetical protein